MTTRWGSREELLEACKVAKRCKLDILVDAVLNVSFCWTLYSENSSVLQHKHGGDATEKAQAVPSNPDNRLKDAGKQREIEVRFHTCQRF